MALTERSRSVLYQGFMSVVHDEQAVQEMLGYFPARDLEEPVTRDVLHAEMAGLRTEFAEFRMSIHGEMETFRTEIRGEMGLFRTEVTAEIHRMLGWNLAAFISMAAVIVAAVRL